MTSLKIISIGIGGTVVAGGVTGGILYSQMNQKPELPQQQDLINKPSDIQSDTSNMNNTNPQPTSTNEEKNNDFAVEVEKTDESDAVIVNKSDESLNIDSTVEQPIIASETSIAQPVQSRASEVVKPKKYKPTKEEEYKTKKTELETHFQINNWKQEIDTKYKYYQSKLNSFATDSVTNETTKLKELINLSDSIIDSVNEKETKIKEYIPTIKNVFAETKKKLTEEWKSNVIKEQTAFAQTISEELQNIKTLEPFGVYVESNKFKEISWFLVTVKKQKKAVMARTVGSYSGNNNFQKSSNDWSVKISLQSSYQSNWKSPLGNNKELIKFYQIKTDKKSQYDNQTTSFVKSDLEPLDFSAITTSADFPTTFIFSTNKISIGKQNPITAVSLYINSDDEQNIKNQLFSVSTASFKFQKLTSTDTD